MDDSKSPVIKFECRCKKTRTQNILSGYSNLVSHVKERHPGYLQRMQQTLDTISTDRNIQMHSQFLCVPKQASNLYSWLEWTVMDNNPLSFFEKTLVKKYSKLESVCSKTIGKYIGLLTRKVETLLQKELPGSFGLVLDGWTYGQTHYVGLFAVYPYPANAKQAAAPLLAFSPLLNE